MTAEATKLKNNPSRATPSVTQSTDMKPSDDLLTYLRAYARERPDVAAMWCFGIGFVLGWKLKPW